MNRHNYTIQAYPSYDSFLLKFTAYSEDTGSTKIAGPSQIENLLGEATFNLAKKCNYHPKNVFIDRVEFKEVKIGLPTKVICPNNDADPSAEDKAIEIHLMKPDGDLEIIKSYEKKFNNHTFLAMNEKASEILDVFPSGVHINELLFIYPENSNSSC